jgi:succinate dehydrogenase / fumarate reductase, membrane anchor subunit
MLKSATSSGRGGLQDWLIQRISAILLSIYILFLISFLVFHPINDYLAWHNLFAKGGVKFATFIALLCLLAHSWIGIWTVLTDYLHNVWIRLCLQIFIAVLLLLYLIWGIQILWR